MPIPKEGRNIPSEIGEHPESKMKRKMPAKVEAKTSGPAQPLEDTDSPVKRLNIIV
ncbi:MAG: hypothetical protein HY880_07480 [Deltaproteobacteria bacterium]|nr:hypothetical protein [Deltaproteobacteria bacterium]